MSNSYLSGGKANNTSMTTTNTRLERLNDVFITSPSNGQGLIYNGNLWQNYNLNLSLLSDVVIQELADGG